MHQSNLLHRDVEPRVGQCCDPLGMTWFTANQLTPANRGTILTTNHMITLLCENLQNKAGMQTDFPHVH